MKLWILKGVRACPMVALAWIALLPISAHAKEVGHYSVRVDVKNQTGGKWNDFLTALSGWSCTSGSSVSFSEVLRDNHGTLRPIPRKSESEWNFFSSPSVEMRFDRDMAAADPSLQVTVSENCSKTTYHSEQTCTGIGPDQKCDSRLVSDTIYANMDWVCRMPVPEAQPGSAQVSECAPSRDTFSSFHLEAYALAMLRDKRFTATLRFDRAEDVYTRSFCESPQDANRVIVQLTQGVAGNAFQNRFRFHVDIAGHQFDLENSNGILNEEIALCGAGAQIPVRVRAEAVNKVFPNSTYAATAGQSDSVVLSRAAPGNWKKIPLQRRAFLGNWTVNPANDVMVVVRDQSRKPVLDSTSESVALTQAVKQAVQLGQAVGAIAGRKTPVCRRF